MPEDITKSAFAENVLLQEYLRVCSDVRSLEANGDKILSIGVAIFSLAGTVGLEKNINGIFLALPLAIVGLMSYSLMIYVWIFSMCGYKSHLEDVINRMAGQRVLLWEMLVRKREATNLARKLLIGVYLIFALGLTSLSIIRVFNAYGCRVGVGMSGLSVVGLMLLVPAWRQRNRVASRIHAAAQTAFVARSLSLEERP